MTRLTSRHVGALHLAHLDPGTGVGVLVLPKSSDNVWLGPDSVNGSDWNVALRELAAIGWEILADDDDLPMSEGHTWDGREVVALYGRDPIVSQPSWDEVIANTFELRVLAFGTPPPLPAPQHVV